MSFCLADPQNEIEQDEVVQDLGEDIELPDGKIGAKKLAKLKAKAERKAQREVRYTEFLVFIQKKTLCSFQNTEVTTGYLLTKLSTRDSSGKQMNIRAFLV